MSAPQAVLVTGGGGFLGRVLVNQLLAHSSADVHALALPKEALPEIWLGRVKVFRGDITQQSDVSAAAQGCQQIFHLAALVGDGGSDELHERVTVGGTRHVFTAARAQDAAVILTTSICAYGDAIQSAVCHEDTPFGTPQGPYGKAKQGQEALARQFTKDGGRVCVVRPANIIGPGSGPWLLDAAKALRQGLPALVGGGDGNAALAGVDNVADFMRLAASTPAAYGQAFNVHDGLGVSWRVYFNDLARLLGAKPPNSIPRALAYLGATLSEPLMRRLWPHARPPVTREALNLIAWDSRILTDKARALGWTPRVAYAQQLAAIGKYIAQAGL